MDLKTDKKERVYVRTHSGARARYAMVAADERLSISEWVRRTLDAAVQAHLRRQAEMDDAA